MATTKISSNVLADGAALANLNSGASIAFTKNVSVSGNTSVTGNLTVDTNTLFVDSVNNRVGIGTTSPSGALHVVGNQANNLPLTVVSTDANQYTGLAFFRATGLTTNQSSYISIGRNGATKNEVSLNFTYVGDGSNNNRFEIFFYGTSAIMSVLAGGNVGIGVTAPSEKLTIAGNLSASGDAYANGFKLASENFAVAMAIALG